VGRINRGRKENIFKIYQGSRSIGEKGVGKVKEIRIDELDFRKAPIICDTLPKIKLFMGKLWNYKESDFVDSYRDSRTGDFVFIVKEAEK